MGPPHAGEQRNARGPTNAPYMSEGNRISKNNRSNSQQSHPDTMSNNNSFFRPKNSRFASHFANRDPRQTALLTHNRQHSGHQTPQSQMRTPGPTIKKEIKSEPMDRGMFNTNTQPNQHGPNHMDVDLDFDIESVPPFDVSQHGHETTLWKLPSDIWPTILKNILAMPDLDDDTPIMLGTLRHRIDKPNDWWMKLGDNKATEGLHKEYEMQKKERMENTHVFTETRRDDEDEPEKQVLAWGRVRAATRKHTSKTAYYAKATFEAAVIPTSDPKFYAEFFARREEECRPKRQTELLEVEEVRQIQGDTVSRGSNAFDKSIIASADSKRAGGQTADLFVRMPEEELRQALFTKFSEFKYWAISDLRGELKQPFEYLKQVLSDIAVRSNEGGQLTNKWVLKPEYLQMAEAAQMSAGTGNALDL
ncbi:hypothetical protein BJ508DRAFT_329076 [Ascobolus immersus RN42]|uniref:Transcription initiation factor IIF subunit beta n=1 Tax=Ascobolus immersus RN42 TaxID=1160509 RepID=A0A3N4I1N4_ASCIM|nr:hypothetical protein BJ508DRAFT_329076 [Ascobolus immersus RN42]